MSARYPSPTEVRPAGWMSERLQQVISGPEEAIDLAEAALLIATHVYPDLDVAHHLARIEELAKTLKSRIEPDSGSRATHPCAQSIPVRGTRIRRQRGGLLRSAQQLPQRGAGPPRRHPDHAQPAVHGSRRPHRPAAGGREFSGALPGEVRVARRHRRARSVRRRHFARRCGSAKAAAGRARR